MIHNPQMNCITVIPGKELSVMNNVEMTSGLGQFHTNEPDANKPDKALTPYLGIGLFDIRDLIDNPQKVSKARALWLIPSSLPSRNFNEQERKGRFFMLWADLDDKPPTLPELAGKLSGIIGTCDYELYNTSSAKPENPKARILLPLQMPLSGSDYVLVQQIFNNKLEALGITPDRATERAAQLCYLPNKGDFYGSKSKRDGNNFDPLIAWSIEIAEKRAAIRAAMEKLEVARSAAKERRAALRLSDSPDLISAFNQAYTPQEWMTTAGYDQRGSTFRHPNSETGNYSASVRADANGVLRVNTLSSSDLLYSAGSGAHDAFSAFTILMHQGDREAALKDAGDNLLTIGSVSYNKAMQKDWAKKRAEQTSIPTQQKPNINYESMPDYGETEQPAVKLPFSMSAFSLSGQSKVMESKMLADRFVLDHIAILGQATVIYAKPNTGKTLLVIWMLIESIKSGRIDGKDVFYINADDDYKGLVFKTGLAEQYGFEMLAPGHNGFESAALQGYMRQMIDDDTARGKVIILDTLKKFTDLMNKKTGSEFMCRAREFVAHGGTLIMLAHTNKNRDADGKAVFGGTSDIIDDCDCAFILDEIAKTATTKQVLFENLKSRGIVASELAFSYSVEEGRHYQHRLDSVEPADKGSTEQAKKDKIIADKRAKDKPAIDAITETIEQGITLKTDLIRTACEDSGVSRRVLIKALDDYTGSLWGLSVAGKGAKNYRLLTTFQANAQDYSFFKDGE